MASSALPILLLTKRPSNYSLASQSLRADLFTKTTLKMFAVKSRLCTISAATGKYLSCISRENASLTFSEIESETPFVGRLVNVSQEPMLKSIHEITT